jgi:hypothetical protein
MVTPPTWCWGEKGSKMKYRTRPVAIEAEQFTEALALACLVDNKPAPFGLGVNGVYHPGQRKIHSAYIIIQTPEGMTRADIGDWIVKGVNGELYVCKPDIFESTYESAPETEPKS